MSEAFGAVFGDEFAVESEAHFIAFPGGEDTNEEFDLFGGAAVVESAAVVPLVAGL